MPFSPQARQDISTKANSFRHIPGTYRPGTMCILTLANGQKITGECGKAATDMHPAVQALYALVPVDERGLGHGTCAEADAMSKVFNKGGTQNSFPGGMSRAYLVRVKGGLPVRACGSCNWVLNHLGVASV